MTRTAARCVSVTDATAKVYGVRSIDTGNTLRVVVTATNLAGSTNATSSATSLVGSGSTPTPVVEPQPRSDDQVPLASPCGRACLCTLQPLRRLGEDGHVIETDHMAGRLGYTRRFSINGQPCGTHARNWMLISRFHHTGLFTATLRAVDKSGASSRTVSAAPSASTPSDRREAGSGTRATAPAPAGAVRVLAPADRELVLGVPDPLLDLPAVGARLAGLDRGELGLGGLELGLGGVVVDVRGLHRRRRRGRSHGRGASGRSPGRSRTRSPRRRHRGRSRVEPALRVAISGAWRASTPMSPIWPGTMIISACPRTPRRRA